MLVTHRVESISIKHIFFKTSPVCLDEQVIPYDCRVNANLDLIVSATHLLETLGLSPGQPVDHTHLSTVEELQEQVSYSMQHCAGTERVFSSSSEFQRVVDAAYQLPHTVSRGRAGKTDILNIGVSITCIAFYRRQCSSDGSQDSGDAAQYKGIQCNLRIITLGTSILSIVQRLSLLQR